MTTETVLVIDIGTSSAKAVLFSADGTLLGTADAPIETFSPLPGHAEQDPASWWRATVAAVAGLRVATPPMAVTLTGSMQNVILLDGQGAPLGPAILYSDARIGPAEIARLAPHLPQDFERRIGNRIEGALSLFRLDWLLAHEAALMRQVGRVLFGAKDAVIHRMTSRAVVDPTCATTTGLMDLAARQWDAEVLGALGLSPAIMPDILDADALAGPLLPEAAAALGLPAGIPVHVGAGDAGATAWGTMSEAHDRPHAYLGTTGWIAATMPLAVAAPPRDAYTLAAPIGSDVIVISPFLAAGLAVDWFAALAGRNAPELFAAAETFDAEPPTALFLPYLIGERAPFSDRAVRGAFLGLDREQPPEALAYAVLEGLAHAIRDNLDALLVRPAAIVLAGGVAGAAVVAQLIADVTGATVTVPTGSRLVTAYGALRLAAPVLGLALRESEAETRYPPRAERARRAARRFQAYRRAAADARALATLL